MKGLFLIGRELFDHPIVGLHKPKWFAAWVWMLGEARWKQNKIMVSGKPVILERGQLSCSLRFMAKRLDMSVKGIRTFLDRLESDTMIDTDKGTGQTIITICNYEIYQDFEEYRAQQRAQQRAQEGHSKGTGGAQTRTPETPETPEIKKAIAKKPSRISPDWKPNDENIQYAVDKGFSNGQLQNVAEGFKDHWIAATGKGATALDWDAKWRTWVRNDIKFNGEPESVEQLF